MKGSIKRIAATLLAATAALFASSCASPIGEAAKPGAGKGAVTITIGAGGSAGADGQARTAFPTTPSAFTKYRLTFSQAEGKATQETLTFSKATKSVELEPGTWDITAEGFATFAGTETVVAKGTKRLTVTVGQISDAAIEISSYVSDAEGELTYSIEAEKGLDIQGYSVRYGPYGDESSQLTDEGTLDASTAAASKTVTRKLRSGYYALVVTLKAQNLTATKMEIAHVGTGLSTPVKFSFSKNDFDSVFVLSGTLSLTANGKTENVKGYRIVANCYKGQPDKWPKGISYIASNDGSWSVNVPKSSWEEDYYVYAIGTDSYGRRVQVELETPIKTKDQNVSGIALSKSVQHTILSGTLDAEFRGARQNVDKWTMSAWADGNYKEAAGKTVVNADGTWTMAVEPLAQPTSFSWYIEGRDANGNKVDDEVKTADLIGNDNATGIKVTMSNVRVKLSGNIRIIKDGTEIYSKLEDVTAHTDPSCSAESRIPTFTAYYDENGYDNQFALRIRSFTKDTPVYFKGTVKKNSNGQGGFEFMTAEPLIVRDAVNNDLECAYRTGNVSIGGTLRLSTMGGSSRSSYGLDVYVYSDPSRAEGTLLYKTKTAEDENGDGTWSYSFPRPDQPKDFYVFLGDNQRIYKLETFTGVQDFNVIKTTRKTERSELIKVKLNVTIDGKAATQGEFDTLQMYASPEMTESSKWFSATKAGSDGTFSVWCKWIDRSNGTPIYFSASGPNFKERLLTGEGNVWRDYTEITLNLDTTSD